jgi:hypothetical protein
MSAAAVHRWIWVSKDFKRPAGVYKVEGTMTAKQVRLLTDYRELGYRRVIPLDEWLRLPQSPSEAIAQAISGMESSIKVRHQQIEELKERIQTAMNLAQEYLFPDKQN